MSAQGGSRPPVGFGWRSAMAAVAVAVLSGLILWGYRYHFPGRIGPEQPVPFSHRVHAGVKKISCLICHESVAQAATAGVPPMETCMLCHARIIVTHPQIRKVRQHYFDNVPIVWTRIYNLPDFVYFNHAVHIRRSIDCSMCHGNVSLMDRVEEYVLHTMGFCIECHRKTKAPHDCFTCHR